MFKKDDKVKVIKGIKAFEGLTGTVLDTNGNQVKVRLNLSNDAELQKNLINVFEAYQLELESLDLLKEDNVSFDNDVEYPNPSFTTVVEDSWNHLAYDLGKDPVLLSDLVNDIQGNYEGYEDVSDTEIKEILHRGNWDYVDDLTDDYKPEIKGTLEEGYTTNTEAAEQAIKLYRTEPNVEGVFFGVDTKDGFIPYVKTYHNDAELQEINNQIDKSFPNHWTVWAAHSDYAINEIERQLKNKLNKKNESLTEQEKKFLDKDRAMYVVDYLMQNHLLDTIDKEELDDILYNRNNEVAFNHKLIELGIKDDFDKEYNKPVEEGLKLTEEELKAWCSDNDANYYTQDIKDDKVIIRGLNEDLGEYDFKTKELKVFDYSGTTTQEQDLEEDYDDNYIRDYVYDVDMLDEEEYPSWEFVSVIATAENISDDSVIEEAHNRGFKVFIIQAANYEKFVVAAEKITEEDIMEDFAAYLEGNPKVTEMI